MKSFVNSLIIPNYYYTMHIYNSNNSQPKIHSAKSIRILGKALSYILCMKNIFSLYLLGQCL